MLDCILVVNSGSTSFKFGFYDLNSSMDLIISGLLESLTSNPKLEIKSDTGSIIHNDLWDKPMDHIEAIRYVVEWVSKNRPDINIKSAGHRVVLGGDRFSSPVLVNSDVVDYLNSLSVFVPSHQPFNVAGIVAISKLYPHIPQVAVFDSSFHLTMPEVAKIYPLPKEYRELGVKHWGFHGISYDFITKEIQKLSPNSKKTIVAHLGGGSSLCAISDGKSIETTMQFSGLTGLAMSTRSGDIPADVLIYLLKNNISLKDLESYLYKKSGLLGLSEKFSDMRQIQESDRVEDKLAFNFYIYDLLKYFGSYIAILGGLDSIVFTAGIGQNSSRVRGELCSKLEWLGLKLDNNANENNEFLISTSNSTVKVMVIPTNEEVMIAQYTNTLTNF